jgi:transposase-like protein
VVWALITRPCGAGSSATLPNWKSECDGTSSRPTNRGGYLYRAIDSAGATIDFSLSVLRDADPAKRLFRQALKNPSHPQPRVLNTDLAAIYSSAIPQMKKEGTLRRRCRHRPVQYLNNILEQDHRAIKRRVNVKQGFRISKRPDGPSKVMKQSTS